MKVSIKDVSVLGQSGSCNESDATEVISVFLKGKFVEKLKIVKEQDVLIIKGAQIEKSSREGDKFNIIADESNDGLKIWIIQGSGNNDKTVAEVGATAIQKSDATGHATDTGGNSESPSKRRRLVLQPKPAIYTKLADLKVGAIINVYGVVKFFKSPFKTKGSDFVCTLSLVDPSLDSLDQSFKLVLFSKSKETLPLVKSVGDVVRFHQIAVGEFKGELQGKFLPQSSW